MAEAQALSQIKTKKELIDAALREFVAHRKRLDVRELKGARQEIMYLVDTSVWVDFIQQRNTASTDLLEQLLENPLAVGITDLIYMELLQGAKSQKAFDTLQAYFSGQCFYEFKNSRSAHEAAAGIYFKARRRGITLHSSLDCLVAQTAIEHELILLHQDRDYLQMEPLLPELKQKHFLASL